jgi:predicted lipoprotein with Yx(FWY)xxD motif
MTKARTPEVFVLISRTRVRVALCGVLAGVGLASVAALAPMSAGAKPRAAMVNLRKTHRGMLLVSGSGFTLYMFSSDKRNTDMCVSRRGCTAVWPPDTTGGKPIAGKGVKKSLLATITLSDRTHQVTYGGHPLYSYTGDISRGETDYIGTGQFGGFWHAITADAKAVN